MDHSIYGVDKWGRELLEVLDNGDIGLKNPMRPNAAPISLPGIIRDLDQRGVQLPLLLRVSSYLDHEITRLNDSFAAAIRRVGYKGAYRGVFPVKVNQQAQVIDRIVDLGAPYH